MDKNTAPISPLGVMLEIVRIQTSLHNLSACINASFDWRSSMNVLGCIMDAVNDLAKVGTYVNEFKPLNISENGQGKN